DFIGICYLQWGVTDLVRLAISRFRLFAQILDARGQPWLLDRFERGSGDPREMLESFLPETVTNFHGDSEPALQYLVRHTQLLPRQFLTVLNTLFRGTGRLDRLAKDGRLIEPEVRRAIAASGPDLVGEVFNAHQKTYRPAGPVLDKLL